MPLPKKYDYQETEPRIARFWAENEIYRFNPYDPRPCFPVDTPPPYVSADHLHIGHAMSYSQAEFIVRYKRMSGHNVFYPMGFDDNGLPTERFVEKKYRLGPDRKGMTRQEFIALCLEETARGAQTYRRLWEQLGISVDWNLSYSTIDARCQKAAQKSFLELAGRGLISRRQEPVQWCYACRTSCAQADIELEECSGQLHTIAFSTTDGTPLRISTTRPELMAACTALYCNPDDERYRHLLDQKAIVALFGHAVPFKTNTEVDPTFGTGLMMVCPWGDAEDVKKWRIDRLDVRMIFDESGKMNDLAGPLAGLTVSQARQRVIELLAAQGLLLATTTQMQRIGVHERCGTPIEFRSTPQWFLNILDMKGKFLELGAMLDWNPPFMKQRYDAWVDNLKWDWCISRQRTYGVALPLWYCASCSTPYFADPTALPVDPVQTLCPGRCACGCAEFKAE
ncbi:MAG: class I tRNA ligase family protein, partial [Chitinivibrionales bacterium]|nr:class I tRNA ligase family protein [Chitinivibrionales bacterium]